MPQDVWLLCADEAPPPRALELAGDLARADGGRVTVLHVVPAGSEAVAGDGIAAELLGLPPSANGDGDGHRFVIPGVPTETVVIEGQSTPTVLGAVHEGRPDVVVAARRRSGPLRRWLGDDPARALAREAACPVVVVPDEPARRP